MTLESRLQQHIEKAQKQNTIIMNKSTFIYFLLNEFESADNFIITTRKAEDNNNFTITVNIDMLRERETEQNNIDYLDYIKTFFEYRETHKDD